MKNKKNINKYCDFSYKSTINNRHTTKNTSYYLRSYKMEDNKQYHSISYTMMILIKLIGNNQKLSQIKR